jgi:hypothetical protein
MESQIEVQFFRGGTPTTGTWVINQASQHPDITDLTLEEIFKFVVDVASIVKDVYTAATADGKAWFDVAKDIGNLVKDIFTGKNQGKTINDRLILLGPGAFPSAGPAVDEARVTFRAWSEDDLTASLGRVDPFGKIIDLGERRYDEVVPWPVPSPWQPAPTSTIIHHYEHSFSIPLRQTPPGPYFFSFASGDDGWRYKVGIASLLTLGIAQNRHSGFLVQNTMGQRGNFEVVVPRVVYQKHVAGGGLSYFWRDRNSVPSSWAWRGIPFLLDLGQVDAVSLIQSNLGVPGMGSLELVTRIGDRLLHFWRAPDAPPGSWSAARSVGSGASGNPALLQSTFGIIGHFELVVPRAARGLSYYYRDNDRGANFSWHGPFDFATDVGQIDAVSLIQSNFGPAGIGQLEVVARIGNGLAHFRRVNDAPPYQWLGPQFFAEGVSGIPSLIQGWHGNVGNYELVVPRPGGGLAHYWRNNDAGQNLTWNGPFSFAAQLGQVDALSIIQSNIGTPKLGNLEVVARIGDRLAYMWRMDVPPWTWSDPIFFDQTSTKRLLLRVEPYPCPLSRLVTVTVFATDETTGQPVDGEVIIDDSEVSTRGGRRTVGRTNRPFTFTFMAKTVSYYDPEAKGVVTETYYPTGSVVASGYDETPIDWGFRRPQ